MRLFVFILMSMVILLASCNRPECTNYRGAFSKYQPDDIAYKRELARLVDSIGKDNLRYWVKGYDKHDDKELIEMYVQNESVCAVVVFDATGATGVEHLKAVAGGGYSGAELKGVSYSINRGDTGINFVMNNVEGIID